MDNIINKIISIDEKAKEIISNQKYREENIEDIIKKDFNTKKAVLDLQYKDAINKEKEKYEKLVEEKTLEIDKRFNEQIREAQEKYNNYETKIKNNIINEIKNEE